VVKMAALDDTLSMLRDQTDQVAVRASAIGQESLRRDLRRISDDHQAVTANAKELVEQLQLLLQKWEEFESSYSSFSLWLETTTNTVRNAGELAANLSAKLQHVSTLKVGFIFMLDSVTSLSLSHILELQERDFYALYISMLISFCFHIFILVSCSGLGWLHIF